MNKVIHKTHRSTKSFPISSRWWCVGNHNGFLRHVLFIRCIHGKWDSRLMSGFQTSAGAVSIWGLDLFNLSSIQRQLISYTDIHLIKFGHCCCRVLTQQGRVPVSQGKTLVAGHVEGRQEVKFPLQKRLQAASWGIGWMEQVVDLLTGRPQLGN